MSELRTDAQQDADKWHLDKRIPIATLIAIVAQALALGWMASNMDGRLAALEQYTTELKASRVRERIAVEEANTADNKDRFKHFDDQLDRLEDKVDKIADRLNVK